MRDTQCARIVFAFRWKASCSGVKRCHCPSIAQLPLATGSRILRSTQPFSIRYSTTGESSLRLMRSRVKPILTVKPLFQDIADLFSLSLDCFRSIRRDQDPADCPTPPPIQVGVNPGRLLRGQRRNLLENALPTAASFAGQLPLQKFHVHVAALQLFVVVQNAARLPLLPVD